MKYYCVEAKCGHVGKGYYILRSFPIRANSKKEAASIARNMPRVKHDHKDAIRNVEEIQRDEYLALIEKNNRDPYSSCRNIQEQRATCGSMLDEIIEEDNKIHKGVYEYDKRERQKRIAYKRQKLKERYEYGYREMF